MRCEDFRSLFELHVLGDSGAGNQTALEAHVEGCDACRREFEAARERVKRLRASAPQPPALPVELAGKARARAFVRPAAVRARVSRRRGGSVRDRLGRAGAPSWLIPTAIAAAVVLALGLLAMLAGRKPNARRGPVARGPERQAPANAQEPKESSPTNREAARPETPTRTDDALEREPVPETRPENRPAVAAREPAPQKSGAPRDKGPRPEVVASEPEAYAPARVVAVTGYAVYHRRGSADAKGRKAWNKLLPGSRILPGDEIDTRSSLVHLALTGETPGELVLGQRTWLALNEEPKAIRASLKRGDVYFDLPPMARERSLFVETSEGRVKVAGTRFGVRAGGTGVSVTVAEGRVTVAGRKSGKVEVAANRQVTLAGGRTSKTRKVNAAQMLAWASKQVEGARRVAVRFNFDQEKVGVQFLRGKVVPGSAFGNAGGALLSNPLKKTDFFATEVALEKPATQVFRWSNRMRLRFHYKVLRDANFKVQMHPADSETQSGTIFHGFTAKGDGEWHTFDMPLSKFDRQNDAPIADGVRIINLYLLAGQGGRPLEFRVDNLEFYEPIK